MRQTIVIVYDGAEPPEIVINAIGKDILSRMHVDNDNLHIYQISEDDSAKIIGKVIKNGIVCDSSICNSSEEISQEEHACIYISNEFRDCDTIQKFMSELSGRYMSDCLNCVNSNLVTAVRIIANAQKKTLPIRLLKHHGNIGLEEANKRYGTIYKLYHYISNE